MDIVLLQASAYELPTSRRVGVIVHDGASDTRLWPGPGPDRELVSNYGPDLADTLDRERGARELKVGEIIRLHPGKLHCDFLLWASTRGPEESGRQAKAPDADVLRQVVRDVLEFVAGNCHGLSQLYFTYEKQIDYRRDDAAIVVVIWEGCQVL